MIHLTTENINNLASSPYFVTPKTDGRHEVLVCSGGDGTFTLHMDGLRGVVITDASSAPGNWGFLLDVEIFQIPFSADLIFAFDSIGIDSQNSAFCTPPDLLSWRHGLKYSDFNGHLRCFLSHRIPKDARERHALLLSVIEKFL